MAANAVGGVKISPQNKDISDTWVEWYEGLNNDMTAYASACNGEINITARKPALFPQDDLADRLHARESYVVNQTAANSAAINRKDRSVITTWLFCRFFGARTKRGVCPTRYRNSCLLPRSSRSIEEIGCSRRRSRGAARAAPTVTTTGINTQTASWTTTFQDHNIHEPGVVSETTVDGNGPFLRFDNNYFFPEFGPPQDEGSRQNIASRNTKHVRSFWDSTPRSLHHGFADSVRAKSC